MEVYVVTNLNDGWDCVCTSRLSVNSLVDYFKDKFEADWDNCKTIDDIYEYLEGSAWYVTLTYAK